MQRVLYQFPLSHYCEKVRWVLDHKGIPYRIHNQLPGLHARANRRLTGSPTVPVLVEAGRGLTGSHAIALHLEACSPERPLLPKTSHARAQLDRLAQHFDDVVGPAVRAFVYSLITPDPAQFSRVFFRDYRGAARWIGRSLAWPLSRAIANMYQLESPRTRELPDVMRGAADRVERQLAGKRFLLEDALSLADITVASLLGPVTGPAESPWADDLEIEEFDELRAEFRARPIGDYLRAVYGSRRAAVRN